MGTPTISCIMNVIREREIDALVMPWANARVSHLLSMHRAMATVVDDQTSESANPNWYDEVVFMRNTETIETVSSHVISVKMGKAYTGECIEVLTQALQTEDSSLPQGLTIQNVYTEFQKGSKSIVVVVRNSMAYPQILQRKALVARAVAVTTVPEMPLEIRMQQKEDGPQDPHSPYLTTRQRQGKLFKELDLSGLNLWPPELAEAAHQLWPSTTMFFSLEPAELGCTHSTKHMIKVTDDIPFKEQFRQIHLPLVEKVQSHLREMLESGAIQPSQSVWCNTSIGE